MKMHAIALSILMGLPPAALKAEAVPAPEAAEPVAPLEPAPAPRPDWLERAEKDYAEGLKALESGDKKAAEKKFRAALKALAKKAAPEALLSLKENIEALFAKLEEELVPAVPEDAPPPEGLEVSEQELESAPQAGAPVSSKSYTIPIHPDDPLVQKYIAIYTSAPRREKMQQALDRMSLYKPMILKHLKEAGLPRELLYLAMAESEFQNTAASWAGAVGLWQFMASTARFYDLKVNYWLDERRDPEKATKAAVRHLKDLHQWFDDWHLALASYNRGLYGVQRDMEFTRSPDFARLSKRGAMPTETEHYVPKFMACVLIGDNAGDYGFQLSQLELPAADEAALEKPLDLRIAAECAGATEKTLRELNPTLRLWCTPKTDGTFALRIPAGTKDQFLAKLAAVKDWTPDAGLVKYRVKRGDFLGKIASRYRTTAQAIQRDNKIKNPKVLRPGQVIVIRPGRKYRGDD